MDDICFQESGGETHFSLFLPRERNDGFGDVHSFVLKFDYHKLNSPLKSSLGVGYIQMPDVLNVELNKYGMPSYYQLNLDVRYKFQKYFKGLESQVLLVSKLNNGETYNNKRYEFNKVNMLLINFVLNYHF
jgi:hypothetical protein